MSEEIEVHIELDRVTYRVGTLRYVAKRSGQTSAFQYHPDWLSSDIAFAIDPANLPLTRDPYYRQSKKSALPGALRDTAPDRWGQQLIKRAFKKAGEDKTLMETDYLLAMNDATRTGALRYKRSGEVEFDHDIGRYRVPPLIALPALVNAADAVLTNTETAEDLKLLLNEGSPLGGARPKSAVQDADDTFAIAKFPKPDDVRSITHGEVLAMVLAQKAGINTAPARLQEVAGRAVVIIGRFDRRHKKRVPFVSAMTMLGLDDGDEETYTGIAEIIRQYGQNPTRDLHELWRRIVFNVLASNFDDHLRNHAFLYSDENKWVLSPAYDLNPVPISERPRELTTWISEEGPDASIELAMNACRFFALKAGDAKTIIAEVAAAVSTWRAVAKDIMMSPADISAYETAFEHNEMKSTAHL